MNDEQLTLINLLGIKEQILAKIIVWLKAKGLWEEVIKDLHLLEGKNEKRHRKTRKNNK